MKNTTTTTPLATKTTFYVKASSYTTYCICIEATSEEEAEAIGRKVSPEHWELEEEGDWSVDYAVADAHIKPDELLSPDYHDTH
ncbi:hypothetical protein [Botrimarina mediterranea]|uniref:hypothetical protein n=1 Tax=Botrimarina mediterranea TaxID=2528022 RepID=UPI00118B261E|nr:hypothetical protein K2D_46730 [Planctomycetes bacterium K2D]